MSDERVPSEMIFQPPFPSFSDALEHWAGDRPGKPALAGFRRQQDDSASRGTWVQWTGTWVQWTGTWVQWTWAELADRVRRRADEIQRESPQLLLQQSDQSVDELIESLACLRLRIPHCPLDRRLGSQVTENRVRWLREHQPPSGANDGIVLWTGGSTGDGRAVCLSQRALLVNAAAKLNAVPQDVDWVRLTVLPISHAYARTSDVGTWLLSGGTLALSLGQKTLAEMVKRVRPHAINAVPVITRRLWELRDAPGMRRFRVLGCGGAAMSSDEFNVWRDADVEVIQGYGLTEAGPVICSASPSNTQSTSTTRAACVGEMVAAWQHRLDTNQVLHVRGPAVMDGYWGDPHATSQVIDAQGWLNTGDRMRVDADGQWSVLGRADDRLTLANGVTIDPMIVERQVAGVAGVSAAMLRVDDAGHAELWLDLPGGETAAIGIVVRMLKHPRWASLGKFHIAVFDPPLDVSHGELTLKGNVHRRNVARRRFGSSAGETV